MPNEHCQSVRDRLGAYATHALDASERADIEAHLASCPDCAERVERLRRAATSLAPLRDEIADRKLSVDRRRQILDGKSCRKRSVRMPWLRGAVPRPALRWAAAAGIAAVAGLAVGLWLVSSRETTHMAARESTLAMDKVASEIAASETEDEESLSRREPAEESERRAKKRMEDLGYLGNLGDVDAGGGATIAQPQLADVVTAPSPFRDQHVLLGVRAARPGDRLSAAGQTIGYDNINGKHDDDTVQRRFSEAEGGEKADIATRANEPAPVRIRFNEQTVRSQRQISDRSRHDRKARRTEDFDAVYEVALKPTPAENREQETETAPQLNVATLEAVAPRRQLTQQVNISSPDQTLPNLSRVNQAAQIHPELYLDACEDELERLAVQPESDSKNGKQPILHQMQSILQAIVEVRPEDPRTQTLLDRVNRQIAPPHPAGATQQK